MTQRETIIQKLNQDGFVSRNWALDRRISRLRAIIYDLKKEGWNFKGEHRLKDNDYYYFTAEKVDELSNYRKEQEFLEEKKKQQALI